MGKQTNRLTDIKARAIKESGLYPDGNGLNLSVSKTGSKSWILRYMLAGKARYMGLGPYPEIGVAAARDAASKARAMIASGVDPIEERERQKSQNPRSGSPFMTFKAAADAYIAGKEKGWKNEKHRQQWRNTLATYACPVIGHKDVAAVTVQDVEAILAPIWLTKPETATRVRSRIANVLDWCEAHGYRDGRNPAEYKGRLLHILPQQPSKKVRVKHHAALPWQDAPAFVAELRANSAVSARALEFLILTAKRTAEVIMATWNELDSAREAWEIPASRMKMKRPHIEPLAAQSVSLLRSLPRVEGGPFIFMNFARRAPLSNMAMLELMRGMRPPYTPHGFRSTFRTWVAEATNYPSDLAEMCLAHDVGSAVEQAYMRSTLIEKRRLIMQDWADFLEGGAA